MRVGQTTRTTQDWQIEVYERQSRNNHVIRQQRAIREAENKPCTWGVNMSERIR